MEDPLLPPDLAARVDALTDAFRVLGKNQTEVRRKVRRKAKQLERAIFDQAAKDTLALRRELDRA